MKKEKKIVAEKVASEKELKTRFITNSPGGGGGSIATRVHEAYDVWPRTSSWIPRSGAPGRDALCIVVVFAFIQHSRRRHGG